VYISSRFHAAVTGDGKLVEGLLSGGQIHDVSVAAELTEDITGCAYDRERYKKRGLLERIFGKLKENQRLTVRYKKSDTNFPGFILNCVS
jgi:hypothetical protein